MVLGTAKSNSKEEDEFEIIQEFSDNGVILSREHHYTSWNRANIWIVKGTNMDLVIDTGIGLWNLHSFLLKKKIIGGEDGTKPYHAVATHVHFDHSGGLHQFKDVAIHSQEATALTAGDSFEACCFMSRAECGKPPDTEWKPKDFKLQPATPTRILEDGDIFDLGNRKLSVIHLPGHSRGSVGLLDETSGDFFSGDVIYQGPMLDCLPYSNTSDNLESIENILSFSDKVKRVYPGHLDTFDGKKLKEIAEGYLRKFGMCHDCTSCIRTYVLRGRNTNRPGPKCCYYSFCCCMCT